MKLNSVVFYLCAGMCSSALIDSAFSMNCSNRFCKLDKYSAMIVSKYFETKQDFVNLGMVNSKFRENMDRFHYNPISIAPKDFDIWPRLETLHLYTDEDIDAWEQAPNDIDDLHKIEVWAPIDDINAVEKMTKLERLVAKSENRNAKITFRNVKFTNPAILGKFDKDGMYTFNKSVYTKGERKNANFVVTSIYNCTFRKCEKLKSITIPDSVTSIGYSVFEGCTGLTGITIPNNVTSIGNHAFYECEGLTSITIPDSVVSIGYFAFYGCTGLTSIVISDNVTSIGWATFYGCTGLKSIVIPDSVTSIGDGAFKGCTGLTSIVITDSVKSIGNGAFRGCKGLTSIVIPDSVESINSSAFEECTGLTGIAIPNSVRFIDEYAFNKCIGLTSITIPNNVQSIGNNAFAKCENAKFIVPYGSMRKHLSSTSYIDENLIDIREPGDRINEWIWAEDEDIIIPYGMTSINDIMFKGRKNIKSITIPNSVTYIEDRSFNGCEGLTSITIPNSVKSIGYSAFEGCQKLKHVKIPYSVTYIGEYAFALCQRLTSITIPNSVTSIGSNAFYGCKNLNKVFVYSDRVKDLVINNESEIDPGIIEVIKKPEEK